MEPHRPRFSKKEKKLYLFCGGLVACIFAFALWWGNINADPVVNIPTPKMPNPNAWDYYLKAGDAEVPLPNGIDPIFDTNPPKTPADRAKRYSLPAKQAWLNKNAKALQLLRQGFQYQ